MKSISLSKPDRKVDLNASEQNKWFAMEKFVRKMCV